MRGLISILSSLALVMLAGQAYAQSARKMAEHGDWATYSYQAQNGKVCYVLTVPKPKSMQPPSVDHGDMFFFVSQRPGQADLPLVNMENFLSPIATCTFEPSLSV